MRLDVNKPLTRFLAITKDKKRVFYQVFYEKIPKFCYVCGLLGHTYLEHGNGKHEEKDMDWGEWLLAPMVAPPFSRGGMAGGRRGGRRSGAGGGRTGPEEHWTPKNNAKEGELTDTASSPSKNLPGVDAENILVGRKRLNFETPTADNLDGGGQTTDDIAGKEMVVFGVGAAAPTREEDADTSSQDSKRARVDNLTVMDSSDQISAGSEKEPVRSQ